MYNVLLVTDKARFNGSLDFFFFCTGSFTSALHSAAQLANVCILTILGSMDEFLIITIDYTQCEIFLVD